MITLIVQLTKLTKAPEKAWLLKTNSFPNYATFTLIFAVCFRVGTPWKINMEHINHPFRKENRLPNLHEDMFQPLTFQGCLLFVSGWVPSRERSHIPPKMAF